MFAVYFIAGIRLSTPINTLKVRIFRLTNVIISLSMFVLYL